ELADRPDQPLLRPAGRLVAAAAAPGDGAGGIAARGAAGPDTALGPDAPAGDRPAGDPDRRPAPAGPGRQRDEHHLRGRPLPEHPRPARRGHHLAPVGARRRGDRGPGVDRRLRGRSEPGRLAWRRRGDRPELARERPGRGDRPALLERRVGPRPGAGPAGRRLPPDRARLRRGGEHRLVGQPDRPGERRRHPDRRPPGPRHRSGRPP
ncbi:MAG: hypothetical protein AVDCRST_MAG29-1381, partial [uncultured Nocardioidaceae bacterium]